MNEIFITKITAKDCPIVGDIQIPLSEEKRKHLIITGKNGSGKTTFLKELNKRFNDLLNNEDSIAKIRGYINGWKSSIQRIQVELEALQSLPARNDADQAKLEENQRELKKCERYIRIYEAKIKEIEKAQIFFSDYPSIASDGDFILVFFEAKRQNDPQVPNAIQNVNLDIGKITEAKLHEKFIAYLVRLRTTYLNEKDKGERGSEESKQEACRIRKWFEHLEKTLQNLFEREDLRLDYDDKNLNYKIIYENRSFGFNELSDGYSSLIAILAELILRMEARGFTAYDMQGVVLIDEIETHLHIALQKRVLPFLCDFFKNIQFIVTTHSPFVLSSLENAVICDLEYKIITGDLSAYSYDALVEGYFDNDKYSQNIKDKISKYEELCKKDSLTKKEQQQKQELSNYLKKAPTFNAKELESKLNFIELINLSKGGK